ncbi:thiamine pyrophosphate protein domain protein TPP-binding [Gloeothece citriformis PCC 7424]|uniref:Thiamine pyrophosphate protein domain protein TPP-binding n=1 Tax=Gloeothece citriformis (strain PCC 7424) TaxID=65393 RepID=B7KHK4_GLOC7|nr:thiamine pyrophosphate-dependent enzyme [Gloeothece citriformis]ACK70699.1 thiamine pyrophosphate protein domain protein TPP-binding [Gloeothece citriformis PCC 7424]
MTDKYPKSTSTNTTLIKTNSNDHKNGHLPLATKNINIQPSYKDETRNGSDGDSLTVAQGIVKILEDMGIREAFGVSGGAMATLWGALSNSPLIDVIHCRHEGGAAFAATEAYFASNRPIVVFTTAGPGITNALTGLLAARDEGAKIILLSACTSAPQRGRWAIQETSSNTIPKGGLFTPGVLFNYASVLESPKELPQIAKKLALGLSQSRGYVAHISIPTGIQSAVLEESLPSVKLTPIIPAPSPQALQKAIELLTEGDFAIWLGFGARSAAGLIRQLAEKTGAGVMCSPRAKGIFPENHPLFVGVTGLGGHESVIDYMQKHKPLRTLVLGTRLGEPTSFWSDLMIPEKGFVHVDIDPSVPGVAYPHAETFPILSDVATFVSALLQNWPSDASPAKNPSLPTPEGAIIEPATSDLVRPAVLMMAIQRLIIDSSDAVILAESGNSFTWATHLLRFEQGNRYRVSTGVGSMGHTVTGVVGAAWSRQGKAVAIVGDGSMLMNSEVSTAVKYQIPAVWIVLNDGCYNMCRQGMLLLGLKGADPMLPDTNFALMARAMGAKGIRVETESDLEPALKEAMASNAPVVIDIAIDPNCMAPSKGRNRSLKAQGVEIESSSKKQDHQISFPLV